VGDVAAASAAERSPSSAAFIAADSTAKFILVHLFSVVFAINKLLIEKRELPQKITVTRSYLVLVYRLPTSFKKS
jgi:hypothetical protein